MRIVPALLLLLSLPIAQRLDAQYATPYGPVEGSRVRVTPRDSSGGVLTGRLRAFGGDSLLLDVGSDGVSLRLPVSRVRQVEVNDGPDRARSAFVYGGIGLLAGGVAGTLLGRDSLERFVGSLAGMAMGLVGGAVGGALLAPDRWRVVWGR